MYVNINLASTRVEQARRGKRSLVVQVGEGTVDTLRAGKLTA